MHFLQAQQEMCQQQHTTAHTGYFANAFSEQCQCTDQAMQQSCQIIEHVNDDQTTLSTITNSHQVLLSTNQDLLKKNKMTKQI